MTSLRRNLEANPKRTRLKETKGKKYSKRTLKSFWSWLKTNLVWDSTNLWTGPKNKKNVNNFLYLEFFNLKIPNQENIEEKEDKEK